MFSLLLKNLISDFYFYWLPEGLGLDRRKYVAQGVQALTRGQSVIFIVPKAKVSITFRDLHVMRF